MKEEAIIMYDSPEAASYKTGLSGWVDRFGKDWGADGEHMARYAGCTHRPCAKCGQPALKSWTHCPDCREKAAFERYNKREKQSWDGETPLYSDTLNRYFFSPESIADYAENNDCPIEGLRLCICDPIYPRQIEGDYWGDALPEDSTIEDIDPDAAQLIDAVNEHIRTSKIPWSWEPGKYAAVIPGGK